MAQTITPVVHGGSRRRWAGALMAHVFGAAISAGVLGLALGATGRLLGAPWGRPGLLVAAAVAGAYALRELFGWRVPIPELRRQVPEHWRSAFGPRLAAFLYGLGLGPGFFTHLRHGTFVAVAALAVVTGNPLLGMVMLAPFGLGRAVGVAIASASRSEPATTAAGDRLERLGASDLPRVANALASIGLAIAAATATIRAGAPPSWLWPAILAMTFAWAALAKLTGGPRWRAALAAYLLPARLERAAATLVPAAEVAVVALLLGGRTTQGSTLALLLLGGFSAAIFRARAQASLPCGCFGGRKRRSTRWLLARNAALAPVALVGVLLGTPIPFPPMSRTIDAIPVVLATFGLGLTAWLGVRAVDLWRVRELKQ